MAKSKQIKTARPAMRVQEGAPRKCLELANMLTLAAASVRKGRRQYACVTVYLHPTGYYCCQPSGEFT